MSYVEPLMRQNFLEYASYVIVDRAIPDVRDGCKPVQRRILHTLHEIDDGRLHKVANIVGECMKLHPHGDASIGDALTTLANKEYFIEKQGNFGNILTGHPPAAARYIECRLTDLARDTLFNDKLLQTQSSYDGRKQEPVFLPVKLPVLLLLGAEGIAVGMATRILPHNFTDLLKAQVKILNGERFKLLPDFMQGGIMDATEYDDGRGKVRVRAKLEISDDKKKIIIREIPYGTTTETVIASIEQAAQKGKLKVSSIEDRTAEHVEIVLHLTRGIYADEVEPQLYAYTLCEASLSSSIIVIKDDKPAEMTVTEVLTGLTDRLRDQIKAELELELSELEDKQHFLTLEQIFIENKVYKRLEKVKTEDGLSTAVRAGMEEFSAYFVRELADDDITRLLQIRIRRISAFDIEKHRQDIDEIVKQIRTCKRKLKMLTKTTITFLEGLLEKYGKRYPRKTKRASFDVVSKKEVARQNLKVSFDPASGFFGTNVKGSKFELTVSEYDNILIVHEDGTYRVVRAPEKVLLSPKPLAIELLTDEGVTLTMVYREARKRLAWAKKVQIKGFILDKEYELIKEKKGKIASLKVGDDDRLVHLLFVPAPRRKEKEAWYDLKELELCGTTARGTKLSDKPVQHVKLYQRD